jgi:hypothetical protein
LPVVSSEKLFYDSDMLIDDFLPQYDVCERHQTKVHAPVDDVYIAVRRLDISQAKLSMFLFRLRGLSAPSCFTLDDFLKMRFILLGEKSNEELLLGLVGRFWTPSGKLRRLDSEGFCNFNEKGYAKAAWNFSLSKLPGGTVLLATETRVYCTDEVSRRRFKLYWLFVSHFSGLIRREVLQTVKRNAEKSCSRVA